MIGIQAIGTYIPEGRINNRERLKQFDIEESFLVEKIGMQRLAVKASDEETSDLCVKAFADLLLKAELNLEDIDCIVVCTQNPDGSGLPHTSAILHAKLGLTDNCAAFDISLGCSGFVYGLSVIQGFMKANNFRKGILFTADPYSKVINTEDKNTSLLFGDGATATLISESPIWYTGIFKFGSHGKQSTAIMTDPNSNKLSMNGRAVFSFSATTVPKNILSMLQSNGLELKDIDYFALHQGSRYIVDTLKKNLGIEDAKTGFVASDYGNTVSSSIPLILGGLNSNAEKIVIAGFGVGLSWASTVLYKVK